jgi:hypothetical protein
MYAQYIALGDSMSIDLYPALDAGEIDVAVALEWNSRAGSVAPLGAASLLQRNADERYPEFQGRELESLCPGIGHINVAEDGATIGDVFGSQLPMVEESDVPTLITLSVGGNDLLSAFANKPDGSLLGHVVRDIAEALDFLVGSLRKARPDSLVIVTTVYDPSDDTRRIPGVFDGAGPLPIQALKDLNARIHRLALEQPRVVLADAYTHFLGHGVTASPEDRWYWKRSWIEPSAIGASEIRRLWLDALDAATED